MFRFIFVFIANVVLMSVVRAEDWPHFLGPNFNLHSGESGLNLQYSAEGPKKLWEFEKGKGHAGPVVVDDLVVLFHQIESNEVVTCLKAKTGKKKWEHRYPVKLDQAYGITDTPRSSGSVDLETKLVYTLGNDSDLIAFELKTGKIRWQKNLSQEFGEAPFFFGQGSAPLPYQDKLIVHVGAADACVVAFDKKDGKEIWRTAHLWNGSYASPVMAEINGQDRLMVFAGGKVKPSHGGLLCINPTTGQVESEFPWRSKRHTSVNATSPVPCGPNRVFITEDYGLGGVMLYFDKQFKPLELWRSADFGCQFQTPIYHDGVIYGFGGSGGLMIAQEVQNGRKLWEKLYYQTTIPWEAGGEVRDIPINLGHAHMIHADQGFLCLSENGSLLRMSLTRLGPVILSKARLFYAPETWAPPVISNGRLYINQNELGARLICYDISGEPSLN